MKFMPLLILVAVTFALSSLVPWRQELNNTEQHTLTPHGGVTVNKHDLARIICERDPSIEGCDIVMELFTDSDDFFEETPDKQYYNKPAHYDARKFNI